MNTDNKSEQKPAEPFLSGSIREMQELNTGQAKLLHEIKSKIHSIIGDKEESNISDISEQIKNVDYISKFNAELSAMRTNQNELDKILTHLNKII